jgi:hypothetical protein
MHKKDWRCRAHVTPARSPWWSHNACVPRLRQRQSFFAHSVVAEIQIDRIISSTLHVLVHKAHTTLLAACKLLQAANHLYIRRVGVD